MTAARLKDMDRAPLGAETHDPMTQHSRVPAPIRELVEQRIPAHRFLGLQLLELTDGFAKLLLPFRPEFIGDFRSHRWHGGFIALAMDSAGGAAAMTSLTSTEDQLATIDIRVDFLRPAGGKDLVIEGEILRSGNRIVVTSMRAYHPDRGAAVAEGRAVYNARRRQFHGRDGPGAAR